MVDDINDIFDPEAIYPAGGKPERKKGGEKGEEGKGKERSKSFPGICDAIGRQWGDE